MNIVTGDFETAYDKEYSLSKLTTEKYCRDPRFEVILVSMKVNDEPPTWFSGSMQETKEWLDQFELHKHAFCAHNTAFDGFILNHHFDIRPRFLFDTMSMARPLHAGTIGVSLKALSDHYTIGVKGDEVFHALGKWRKDFSTEELKRYAQYCMTDVQLTYMLLHILRKEFPMGELRIIDTMLRMFTEPVLQLDQRTLGNHLEDVQTRKAEILATVKKVAGIDVLTSNQKFAQLLEDLGVEPPMKISPRTGKLTFAFAKSDPGFKALLEHHDTTVQAVVAARLGTKSTIEETRTQSFLEIAERGPLPIPISYYGAHTGRGSGWDKINMQNLPRGGALRHAVKPPPGHCLVACDSSAIEARINAWLSGQTDLVEDFRNKADVYSKFASLIYGRQIDRKRKEVNPETGEEYFPDFNEGFVGKTCLAEGTLVLCERGWIPIQDVQLDDRVWDGEEWVCHKGAICNGWKPTLQLSGLWLTPDHLVWSGTQWLEAQYLEQESSALCQALAHAAESLPSPATSQVLDGESRRLLSGATAGTLNTQSTRATLRRSALPAATSALRRPLVGSDTGRTFELCPTINIAVAYLTGLPLPSPAAITPETARTSITEAEGSRSVKRGGRTGPSFSNTFKGFRGGMTLPWRWTGRTSTAGTSRGISGSSPEKRTSQISVGSQTLRQKLPVYDILSAGPRNRFTVLTAAGPLIVHNCILGLGYGMSAEKLQLTLKNGNPPVNLTLDECARINQLYRGTYTKIRDLWYRCDDAIRVMASHGKMEIGPGGVVTAANKAIWLPNGMRVSYPYLTKHPLQLSFAYVKNRRQLAAWTAMNLTGDWDFDALTRIYGAKVVENIVQALARIVVFDQMLEIAKRFRVVLNAHDENVACVPIKQAEEARDYMVEVMSQPPKWAPDLPIACEAQIGLSYGEAK